jgi:RNA polymerase sigma-70 factor (ECF subfamily)
VALDGPEKLLAEEPDLIAAAQAGDRASFAVLVDRYWDRLYRWLFHLTHDRHAAEDLTQETLLKAFAGLRTFRPDSNFRAWLFRIGHNNFVNQQRLRRGTRQALPADLPAGDEGPVEQTLSREALQHLTRAVGRLPTEFRSAFLLRAEEGLSFRQIAAVLSVTEETARWRVFKARQKLLHALAPELLPPAFQPEETPGSPP